jgi:hypothetical protein
VAVVILGAAFRLLGARSVVVPAALLGWLMYVPHWYVYGYYFAEPVLALFSAFLFLAATRLLLAPSPGKALFAGACAGVLLLSRAPFVAIAAGIPLLVAGTWPERRGLAAVTCYLAALLAVYVPWPVRNYLEIGAAIPFTLEGGKIFHQGTYLPGDDLTMRELRELPEYRKLERVEQAMGPSERYKYWQRLARQQVTADPAGQARLVVRKALRFWVYLGPNSWRPSVQTALFALVVVPLGLIAVLRHHTHPLVRVCGLWVAGLWAFHALVHAELRYNFPVLPMALALAGTGALTLFGISPHPRSGSSVGPNRFRRAGTINVLSS